MTKYWAEKIMTVKVQICKQLMIKMTSFLTIQSNQYKQFG